MAKESGSPRTRRRRSRAPTQAARRRRALLAGGISTATIVALAGVVVLFAINPFGGGTDEEAIKSLGQRSIEDLPPGDYSSFYESFTSDFRLRCPRDEFMQAGEEASTALGDDRPFLKFKRLEDVLIQDQNARAVIVGQVAGQTEYKVQAAFRKEDGSWKIAPAASTEGCQAFQQLAG